MTATIQNGAGVKRLLLPAEKTMLIVAFAAACVDAFLIWYKSASLDLAGYLTILAVVTALFALGAFYRLSGRSERIGAAAFCAAAFIFYSLCMSLFNYLLLPLWRSPIDLQLNAVDQLFGYHWPSIIEWAGQHQTVNEIIRVAYMSTIPQFAALVVILGLSGRIRDLQSMLLSVTVTATFTICFWGLFPSLGAKSLYDLPIAMESLASPEVSTAYGDYMLAMAKDGPGLISPKEIKGLIAFPSYHIVLAVTAIYYASNVRWAFPIYLILNLIIMPGIYFHGGHHLVDLPAGLAVGFIGIWIANRTMSERFKKQGIAEFAAQ